MSAFRWLRALRLAARLSRVGGSPSGAGFEFLGEESSFAGTAADVYRPCGRSRATWVAVHGLTILGRREPRLVGFARALAAEGLTCVVPTLPHLAAFRWDPGDLDALAAVVRGLAAREVETVGLVGFSFGGSYSLLAASRAECRSAVHRVVTFGAYHRLAPLLAANLREAELPGEGDSVDRVLFAKLVLVLGGHVVAGHTAVELEQMRAVAARYCTSAGAAEKREFLDRHIRKIRFSGRAALPPQVVLERLSPAGRLSGLACPVTVIHDLRDPDIPAAQASDLYAELPEPPPRLRHRLLLTPLLSHLSPAPALHPGAVARFAGALSDFFPRAAG